MIKFARVLKFYLRVVTKHAVVFVQYMENLVAWVELLLIDKMLENFTMVWQTMI